MSRVGKEPVPVPSGVTVTIDGRLVKARGSLGELEFGLPEGISFSMEDNLVKVMRSGDSGPQRALHGLSRALIANMIKGVSQGFSKDFEIIGVGYRCEQREKAIQLAVGYSHRVIFVPPEGIEIKVNSPTTFTVKGIDKELVGEVSAKIRAIKPPEPYKGKGIRYANEYVRRKAGKAAGK